MSERISKLVRTDLALIFLCVISIGVLILLARGSGRGGDDDISVNKVSPTLRDPLIEALAHSPLKDMPEPSKFRSFTYEKGATLSLTSTCKDTYRVVIVYPATVDYRIDPLSATYNTATPCSKGPYSLDFPLDSARLTIGTQYYIVIASEGEQGIWHDPE